MKKQGPEELNRIVDKVLAFRPPAKKEAPKKTKPVAQPNRERAAD